MLLERRVFVWAYIEYTERHSYVCSARGLILEQVFVRDDCLHIFRVILMSFSLLKDKKRGWRNESVLTSPGCYCRGPKFDSQHWHGELQASPTSATRDMELSSGFCRDCTHVPHICTCRQTPTYIKTVSNTKHYKRSECSGTQL